jgi:NADH:ubiquinone oxidoreductase subunit 6 (subunit J)
MRAAVVTLCVFATLWFAFGLYSAGSHLWVLYGIAVVLSVALVLGVPKNDASPAGTRRHRARVIGIASGLEALAIVAALLVIPPSQQAHWVTPVIAAIVGLHFIPIAHYLPYKPYYIAGIALVCVAVAGAAIDLAGFGDAASQLTVGLGSAIVLWLTSAAIVRTARLRATISSDSQAEFR